MKFGEAIDKCAVLLEADGIEIAPGIKQIGEKEYQIENCDEKNLPEVKASGGYGGRERVYIYTYTINGTKYDVYAFSNFRGVVIEKIFKFENDERICLYITENGNHLVWNRNDAEGRGGKLVQDYDLVEKSRFFAALKEIINDTSPEANLKRYQATHEGEDVQALKNKLKKGIDGYRWIHPGLTTDGHYEEDHRGNAWNQKTKEIVEMLNKKGDDEYGIPLGYSIAWDLLIEFVMNPENGWRYDSIEKYFELATNDHLAGAMYKHLGIPDNLVEELKKNTLMKQKAEIADKLINRWK